MILCLLIYKSRVKVALRVRFPTSLCPVAETPSWQRAYLNCNKWTFFSIGNNFEAIRKVLNVSFPANYSVVGCTLHTCLFLLVFDTACSTCQFQEPPKHPWRVSAKLRQLNALSEYLPGRGGRWGAPRVPGEIQEDRFHCQHTHHSNSTTRLWAAPDWYIHQRKIRFWLSRWSFASYISCSSTTPPHLLSLPANHMLL